jgi:hypothetical protein
MVAALIRTRLSAQGIELLSVHASGGIESGHCILRSAGFKELGEPVPGRVIFELDEKAKPIITPTSKSNECYYALAFCATTV